MNRTLLSNAMSWMSRTIAICAVAISTALVSCEYDDTGLSDRVGQLEERVTKLEKDLTEQVEGLQQMLNGKLTIASCTLDEKTGLYTIVLSDGKILTIAQVAKDAPVMGVVAENGVYYWTLNGDPLLTGAGDKVPVATTPGIRVNTKNNEWEISPDGGKTWQGTGIKASENASLFSKVDEDEGNVYFTLADGTELKVAKSSNFRCTALAGKQFFKAGETRKVKMQFSDVKKYTINKPDGWKASIEEETLNITAPAQENTYAETKGKVTVVAVAANGQVSISEVPVEIGTTPLTITMEGMNVKFERQENQSDGYFWGAKPLAEFSPEKVVEEIKANTRLYVSMYNEEKTVAEMLGSEPQKGVTYVIYSINQYYGELNPEDMQFTTVSSVHAVIEAKEITYEDAQMSIEVMGVTSYYALILEAANYSAANFLTDIKEGYVNSFSKLKYNGKLSAFANGLYPAVSGTEYVVAIVPIVYNKEYTEADIYTKNVKLPDLTYDGTATATVSELSSSMSSITATLTPSSETYKYYAQHFTVDEIGEQTEQELVAQLLTGYGSVKTAAPAVCKFERTGIASDTKGFIYVIAVSKDGKAGKVVKQEANTKPLTYSSITLETAKIEVGVTNMSITVKGNADIVEYRYMNITDDNWTSDWGAYQGDVAKTESAIALFDPTTGWGNDITVVTAADGYTAGDQITISFPRPNIDWSPLEPGTDYHFFILGYDKNGYPTHALQEEYAPGIQSDMFVTSKNSLSDKWIANQAHFPQISNLKFRGEDITTMTKPGEYDNGIFTADVTVGTKCAEYWIFTESYDDYISGVVGDLKKSNKVIQWSTLKSSGNQTGATLQEWGLSSHRICIVWKDTDGYYYALTEYEWQKLTSYYKPEE